MAVDTAAKRFSLIHLACPWRGIMTFPSGVITADVRITWLFLYAGGLVLPVPGEIGDPIIMSVLPHHELSRPLAVVMQWQQVIDAGGVDDPDNGGSDITNPDTQIGDTDHHILKVNKRGTFLQVRLAYDDGLNSITDLVIQLFGRYSSEDAWQRLRNLAESVDVTLITNTSLDVTDGTMKYTDPDYLDQTIDLDATDEVKIGVKTPLSGTGDVTTAVLQAKLIGGIRSF